MGYSKVPMEGAKDPSMRWFQRKVHRLELSIKNALFPISGEYLLWGVLAIGVLNLAGFPPCYSTIMGIHDTLEGYFGQSIWNRAVAVVLVAVVLEYAAVLLLRLGFTVLLYYHGWLFETIGKPISLPTKAFMLIVQQVYKQANGFFCYNDLMPWQLIPSIDATLNKYLRSVRPLLNDAEYEKIVGEAEDFKNGAAPELQRKLWLKWLTSKNYVSDWWKEVVYMRYRNSLIATNVGCGDVLYQKTTHIQAARAAVVTLLRQHFFREVVTKQSMRPITMGGIPLCANQYLAYHRSLRAPNETSDITVRLPDAKHIVVYSKGVWYRVNIFHRRRMLRAAELERVLQAIIDRKDDPSEGESHLGALTAGPRDLWAKIRREKFGTGLNHESLSAIENALEIIYLDDEERFYDEADPTKYEREVARALHGDGYRLWCDKNSVYYFSKNGRFSSNAEHSVSDAVALVHVREYIKYHEQFDGCYGPDGHCTGEADVVPTAERIHWNIDQEISAAIDEAFKISKGVAQDFQNAAVVFKDFGKDFVKKIRVSPDAFVQMALQMAYYKDQGKFELTYEPTIMRLFKNGRTETVRSVSVESCDFVRSMADQNATDAERLSKLRIACDGHQDYYRHAMAGQGVDRHLFALYVVSKYFQVSSPFLESVFAMNYKLSTSQTPQHQMAEYGDTLNKDKVFFWPAGGFCCPDGSNYGVCYTIEATGKEIFFHVSTWKSVENTDARRFISAIEWSLREMKAMCERGLCEASNN